MTPFRRLVWTLLWPVRSYIRCFPIHRGKGLLVNYVLIPILPRAPATFSALLPGGAKVDLKYREQIGLSTLIKGTFEAAELEYVCDKLKAGDVACDVGANIGIYSVVMGLQVQSKGRVMSFEPLPENILRLKGNVLANKLVNVDIYDIALSGGEGDVNLYLADDSAYSSTVDVREGRGTGTLLTVKSRRLDDVWKEEGRPLIKLFKIDVEGSEEQVLNGALRCIEFCRPTILIEANEVENLDILKKILHPLGYKCIQPKGFHSWNWLFEFDDSQLYSAPDRA